MESGVRFTHNSGRAGRKWLPETLGAGTALFDMDGDGWLDVLFVNGRDWQPRGRRSIAGAVPKQRKRHVRRRDARQRP